MESKSAEVVIRVMAEKIEALESDLILSRYRVEQLEAENKRLTAEVETLTADNARYARVVDAIENYAGEVAAREVLNNG